MKFLVQSCSEAQIYKGRLVYLPSDYGFVFEAGDARRNYQNLGGIASGSLLWGDLEVRVNPSQGQLAYVHGYCPLMPAHVQSVESPHATDAHAVVSEWVDDGDADWQIKSLYRGDLIVRWNRSERFVRLDHKLFERAETLEWFRFADGCFIGLDQHGHMWSLGLKYSVKE